MKAKTKRAVGRASGRIDDLTDQQKFKRALPILKTMPEWQQVRAVLGDWSDPDSEERLTREMLKGEPQFMRAVGACLHVLLTGKKYDNTVH